MKNFLVVTGGAGFIGSNLIDYLLKKTKYNILSLDNYSSGSKDNHIINKRVRYIIADTINIKTSLKNYKDKIHTIFHFGEFSRIYQSFKNFKNCENSNVFGSRKVFEFCLDNKIKLIYSATSASLGNKGADQNLSPYAFTKAKNLEFLSNLKKWFDLKYEVIYFYNVYGPKQIKQGEMATVIGIFEDCFDKKKALPVVMPGTQTRSFTHVQDTVQVCFEAWKKNKCLNYSVYSKKSYSIIDVAKMFNYKIKFIPPRKGERFASALKNIYSQSKIHKRISKIRLKDYIRDFIDKNSKN